MATIVKRQWRTSAGKLRSAWVLCYRDQSGPHRQQFPSKHEAQAERIRIESALSEGTHVPDDKTVHEAAQEFLDDFERLVERGVRDRSSYRAYEQHVRLHIAKRKIAGIRLARLS